MIYYTRPGCSTVYAMSAKCGCTSLQKALKAEGFTKTDNPRDGRSVLLVVRHPLERLVSCWSFFRDWPAGPGRKLIQPDTTFPKFVTITEQHDDVHWQSQTALHTDGQGFIPTRCIALERLDELWPEVGVGKLERHRVSRHGPWQDYYDGPLAIRCAERYADDLALWKSASYG